MHPLKTWFRNLKVSQKLMLITVFFVMPDSLMFYFFITGMNANIRFAELEKMGNEYQRPLERLLQLIPEHRALAGHASRGDAALAGELQTMEHQIDAAFDALEAVDARIGPALQFTEEGLAKRQRQQFRVETLRADWEALRTVLLDLTPAERAARHLRLVAGLRTMITHAGDNSNLILDPDLDSYYVMDATLLALPATQDRLAAVMAHAETDLQQDVISTQERQQLAVHAALLQESDLDRIRGSLQTALNEDGNFYGVSATLQERLPAALAEFTAAAEAIIGLTRQLASEETVDLTAAEYRATGQLAREASFRLWTVAAEELDRLLDARIHNYKNRRTRSMIVAGLALLAALGFVSFITRSISGPLRRQAAELRAANETLQAEIAERIRAEEKLASVHRELLESSRKAGMAEVATGVLHNVGNVLNSVNVAASLALEKLRNSKVEGLAKATVLLAEHERDLGAFMTSDPQGQRLPRYLQRLSSHLLAENAAVRAELEQLGRNIEHIKEIVSMQQSYARVTGVLEDVPAERLIEDALQLNTASFSRHGIAIERAYTPVPPVRVDRHKVLQILINLLRNAKHAVEDAHPPAPRIGITVEHAANRVRIAVADNGVGIAAAHLTSIFRHGFTTKKNGHGFGLHSGANAAREMGGSLTAASQGPGLGATFTLELPIAS